MRICLIQTMDTINLTTSVSCIYPPCSGDSLTSTTWPETHLREKNEKKALVFLRKIFTPGWVTTASLSNAYGTVWTKNHVGTGTSWRKRSHESPSGYEKGL